VSSTVRAEPERILRIGASCQPDARRRGRSVFELRGCSGSDRLKMCRRSSARSCSCRGHSGGCCIVPSFIRILQVILIDVADAMGPGVVRADGHALIGAALKGRDRCSWPFRRFPRDSPDRRRPKPWTELNCRAPGGGRRNYPSSSRNKAPQPYRVVHGLAIEEATAHRPPGT
jgi:hypothetical protein